MKAINDDECAGVPTCGVCGKPRPTYRGHEACIGTASGGRAVNLQTEAVLDYLVEDGRYENQSRAEHNRRRRRERLGS